MPTGFPLMFPPGLAEPCVCPPIVANGQFVLGGGDGQSVQNLTLATNNNYTFTGLANTSVLLLTTQGNLNVSLTGLATAGLPNGFMLWVQNIDQTPNLFTLEHADAGSLAANRFYLPGAVDLVLAQYAGTWLRKTDVLNAGAGGWLAIEG